jgi:PAS domain S-box-containing protein
MIQFFIAPNREKNYQGYLVFVFAIIWWVATGAIVSIDFYSFPQLWLRWLAFLTASLFIAGANLTLIHLGYTRLAGWSHTIMQWLYITIYCYSAGGILVPGMLSQMSVILTAGFLLGWRGALFIGLLTIGADFELVRLAMTGYLPNPSIAHNPITNQIGAVISFGTIIALQYYATDHLRAGLITMQREMRKREAADDLTGQKESLEKLRASEERYRSIITVSNTGAWEYHLDTDRVWYSTQYFQMLGLDRPDGTWDNTTDTTWIERLHPDDCERSIKAFDDFLKGGSKGLYENIFRLRHENGDWVWIWSRARRLRDKNGNLTSITLGTHIDISERKKAEEKTIQSEQLIKKITSQVPANTYMFEIEENGRTKLHFVNRGTDAFNHSFDAKSVAEDPDKVVREIVHDDDKVKLNNAMKEARKTEVMISCQYRIVANGQIRWRWMQAIPEKDNTGKVMWYGATSDITSFVDYIISVEQILFDIGHVIRRPISTMLGMTRLIIDNELMEKDIKEMSQKLYLITEEMDKFIRELNLVYDQKRQNAKLDIDISSLIDKRSSLFE